MSRKMKNVFITTVTCTILTICLLFASSRAYADVIWEPEDDFYGQHSSQCSVVERNFEANPPEGEPLKVYKAPDSTEVIATREKGERIGISHSYTDPAGREWGLLYESGWAPMDYLAEVYDGEAFYRQYSGEIKQESGEADISKIPDDKDLYFYEYPGAEEGSRINKESDNPYYTMCFTDPEGHKWGYVSYYYISDGWVCIDAPDATFDELYPKGQNFSGDIGEIAPPEIIVEPIPGPGFSVALVIGIAVAAVVVVTAVILIVVSVNIKKKKNAKQS